MEINMKTITKVGLSALAGALAFTSAHAGEMSVTGSMEASYTKKGGYNTTGQPLGMDKELSITGSGELDNGTTVSYKQTVTDAMAFNDSELVFSGLPGVGGSLALTSTGSPIDAIDDKTPTAFEEANAAVGSVKDVGGVNGTYGLRYTLADMFGSGQKLDVMYVFDHGAGDANADNSAAAGTDSAEDGYDITLGGSVPFVDGLTYNVGYALLNNNVLDGSLDDNDVHNGTVNVNYAMGAFAIGVQKSIVEIPGVSAAAFDATYDSEYIGISYAVNDNFSISYNEIEANKSLGGVDVTQDLDSISVSYTMGGMTIGILDASADNASYTVDRKQTATSISLSVAF